MPKGAKVELVGGVQLTRSLDKVLREAKGTTRKAVRATGRAVQTRARSRAPRDRGVLASDITYAEHATDAEAYVGIPTAAESARYAAAVELGTGDTPAQPYLGPAARSEEDANVGRVEDAINEAIRKVAD